MLPGELGDSVVDIMVVCRLPWDFFREGIQTWHLTQLAYSRKAAVGKSWVL